jgi:predicted P-loop ATPase
VDELAIRSLTQTEILSRETALQVLNIKDIFIQEQVKALVIARAKELRIETSFKKILRAVALAEKQLAEEYTRTAAEDETRLALVFDGKGNAVNTIGNYLTVINGDKFFDGLQFNALTYAPERVIAGKILPWTDANDASARAHCELKYGIHNREKLDDALRIVLASKTYHPIQNIINSIKWDGKDRISELLIKWLKCEDSPYAREVSRLIFAGGIHRLYHAGCKFDDVPVLIGTQQGEGKSTFVRWLAIDDRYFTEISEFEGQKGIEAIEGSWICEIAELLAVTKTKEQEAVKAYITKQNDRYRRPFDRRTTDHPRQCIFIGTTNKQQFLIDKTGNRRFYPLRVKSSGYDLFDHETEIREEIMQCWAEALHKIKTPFMKPCADNKLKAVIKDHQNEALEEDYRETLIEDYLIDKREVCVFEIWKKALRNEYSQPTRKDSADIVLMLQATGEWERSKLKRFSGKPQQYWIRKDMDKIIDEKIPM